MSETLTRTRRTQDNRIKRGCDVQDRVSFVQAVQRMKACIQLGPISAWPEMTPAALEDTVRGGTENIILPAKETEGR